MGWTITIVAILIGWAVTAASEAATVGITIDLRDENQVIHSFGASDAWTCQFVGELWPIEKRREIADLLFSMDVDGKGKPKGIGLSMWRFNVGAGSAEQGDASGISSPWHRAECFLNKDGSYDWDKQKGQQWFLEAAHSRGVPHLLAFTNSPPVHYTLNGIAHSDAGRSTLNLREDRFPAFARFLADIAEHFHKKGMTLGYISPVNEPQWGWESSKQEGSPASNAQIHQLTRLISSELANRDLPSEVVIGEAAKIQYLTGPSPGHPRGDQIKAFWSPSSPCYLGDLDRVSHAISAHSYGTTWPLSDQVRHRQQLREHIRHTDLNLAYWQTEFCILEATDEIGAGHGRDTGMDTALYVARVVHSDLTLANASHWAWWLALSASDYKDGLIYLMPEGDTPVTHDGRVLPSKTLWALGNFSRFARPGMVRVGLTYDDNRSPLDAATRLMASAYIDKKSGQLVVVIINCTTQMQTVSFTNLRVKGKSFVTYTTSRTRSLRRAVSRASSTVVPPRSVVTLVGTIE